MNVNEALNWRYAVKQFNEEKISPENVKQLLDATRLSASAYGLQPYNIVVLEALSIRQKLLPYSYGQDKILHSSHLVVIAAHTEIGDSTVDRYISKCCEVTKKPKDEFSGYSDHMKSALSSMLKAQQQEWAHQQAYIALGNLLTCAALMQIDSCPMTGFDSAEYDRVLGFDSLGLTASVICPIGYRHESDVQAHSPKVRFDYDDIVMEL